MARLWLAALSTIWLGCLEAPPGQDDGNGASDAAPGSSDAAAPVADGSISFDSGLPAAAYTCRRVSSGPTIDGAQDSIWLDATEVSMNFASAGYLDQRADGYQATFVVQFACLHDDDTIYFWFEVIDGANAGEVIADGPNAYQDDAVVLFLDAAGDRSGAYGSDDHAFTFTAVSHEVIDTGNPAYSPTVGGAVNAPSYAIETALAKNALAGLAADGRLGFNVALLDDDSHSDDLTDMFALWAMPLPSPTAECDGSLPFVWCNTAAFASLQLE